MPVPRLLKLRILSGFSQGRRPGEIARELKITSQTLRNHLHHINQKLGTHTRMEAVMHAIRRNLISAPPAIARHPLQTRPDGVRWGDSPGETAR